MPGLRQTIDSFPRRVRRYSRHVYTVVTGRLHRNHHEMWERDDFLRKAIKMLDFNGITGDYAEFGCHGGLTFRLAHKYLPLRGSRRHMWAFDSFCGLPPAEIPEDEHPVWVAGDMATSTEAFRTEARRNGIAPEEMTLVPGYYSDTLDKGSYAGPLPGDIALAYIDCDLFSSTMSVLRFLKPRLKHGMVIAFDDYFCYSSNQIAGERAAMLEFLAGEDRFEFSPYCPYAWGGMSFIVEDKALLDPHRFRGSDG